MNRPVCVIYTAVQERKQEMENFLLHQRINKPSIVRKQLAEEKSRAVRKIIKDKSSLTINLYSLLGKRVSLEAGITGGNL